MLVILVVLFSMIICSSAENSCGERRFRMSPLHQNLKPKAVPTKELNYSNLVECSNKCDASCEGFFFNSEKNSVCSMYNQRFVSMAFEQNNGTQAYDAVNHLPSDCFDVMMNGEDTSGVKRIYPLDTGETINVWCEISTEEGWLVIQRRTDGSEDFFRTWNEYKIGFGDLNNEFWLGNTNIHRFTSQGYYDLRIDLEDFDGNTRYAMYKNFSVASEQDYFRLSVGAYSGDAGDSFSGHSGYNFTTTDKDLDTDGSSNCAERFKGAWWYNKCYSSNLNGLYLSSFPSPVSKGLIWRAWHGLQYSLKRTTMKIRPMEF
ncbi:techylectin-5A-like [Gigantopelta aegis]|uniref:techylectin-5A-like n=1 Tax=Gigantopelta aegis TaxID=1735272 RepID=UPI001B88C476|nr:techylectin-5A-like [Gigantopelta aegis]